VETNNELKLDPSNYCKGIHKKKQIVIGNTMSTDMTHFDLWKRKMSGNFKGTSPYTIALDGTIYQHYDPKYSSMLVNIDNYDQAIIPILLENEGWVMKDFKNNIHLNWCGDIYNRDEPIVKIKWRNKLKWAPYSDNQLESLIVLTNNLIEKFEISRFVSEHNVKISDIDKLEGIYYRSNYSPNYLDVSPAFNFEKFKKTIEDEKLERT
jgi:hypothetical protein